MFGDQKRAAYSDAAEPVRSLLTYLAEVTASVQDTDELFTEFVQVSRCQEVDMMISLFKVLLVSIEHWHEST